MNSSNSKLSSKLKQLRFMQRAAKKQEQGEVAEEQGAANSATPGDGLGQSQSGWIAQASKKMCVVLRTSDPAPMGSRGGKMSFGEKKKPIDIDKEQQDAVALGLPDVSELAVELKGKKRKQQEGQAHKRQTQGIAQDGKRSKHYNNKQHRKKPKN